MEAKQAYEIMKDLVREDRCLLGTLPLGADLVGAELTTEVVVEALRVKGVKFEEGRVNAVDEDPDFVNENFYKENDPQFFPFPMNLSPKGNPVIYRDIDFWQYGITGQLEIELVNGAWSIYLCRTIWYC